MGKKYSEYLLTCIFLCASSTLLNAQTPAKQDTFFNNAKYILDGQYSDSLDSDWEPLENPFIHNSYYSPAFDAQLREISNEVQLFDANSPCDTMGFEDDNLGSWKGFTGGGSFQNPPCCPVDKSQPGLVPGPNALNQPLGICKNRPSNTAAQQTITTGPGTDPNSDNVISIVAPNGGNYSIRIGNHEAGWRSECIEKTFLVTPANAFFTYYYAVVFEDPAGHSADQKPRFAVTMFDQTGAELQCAGEFIVTSDQAAGGQTGGVSFVQANNPSCGNPVWYKDWSPVATDLRQYIGQRVTIRFCTTDCGQGGHYGYAYLDGVCSSMPELLPPDPVCPGQPVQLCAPEGFPNYVWSTGQRTRCITLNNPQDGQEVAVTMTTVQNCTVTLKDTLEVTPIPTADFENTTICEGNEMDFTDRSIPAPGDNQISSWIWDFDDPASGANNSSNDQNPSHLYNTAGSYDVGLTVVSQNGCRHDTIIPVNVSPPPVADFSGTEVCHNDSTVFTDNSSIQNGNIVSWEWNFGDNPAGTSTLANPKYIYAQPGTYDVTLIIASDGGCTDTIVQTVVVNENPVADFNSNVVCIGETTEFADSSTTNSGTINTWTWEFGDGNTGNVQNPTNQYAGPGPYDATLTIVTDQGCSDSITKPVILNPLPEADFMANPVCLNNLTTFKDQSTVSSGNIVQWDWDLGIPGTTSTDQNPTHTYTVDGNYDIQLTVTTDSGCVDSITKPVVVYPLPIANFGPFAQGCSPLEVDFNDSSVVNGGDIIFWSWNFGDPASGNENVSKDSMPSHTYTEPGTYTVTLIVTSDQRCVDTLVIPDIVTVLENPTADFTVFPDETTIFDPAINFTDKSSDNVISWFWNFADGDTSNIQNPVHEYLEAGTYCPWLAVVDENGCRDTATKCLKILPDWIFYVPNAFSPNADGVNDLFIGQGINVVEHEMWVYDRWGLMIYHTDSRKSGKAIPWNGRKQGSGEVAQEDVYVYVVRIEDIFGKFHKYVGHVTLVR